MAGKQKKVTAEQVEQLAFAGCSWQDMEYITGVSMETLQKRFRRLVMIKRAERRLELLVAQRKASLGGNPAMLIWRGKNELGQSDKVDVTSGGQRIIFEFHCSDPDDDDEAQAASKP